MVPETLGMVFGGLGLIFCLSMFPNEKLLLKLQLSSRIRYFFEKIRNEEKKIIAITIDNSANENTTEILDCLKELNVKATFFIIGSRGEKNLQVVDRIIKEDHEIGNQDFEKGLSVLRTPELLSDYLLWTEGVIRSAYDRVGKIPPKIKWFRPETRFYTLKIHKLLSQHKYKCVLGDLHSWESVVPLPSLIYQHLKFRIHPGSIVTLSSGSKREADLTVAVLRKLIPELTAAGYLFHTLSQMEEENEVY